MQYAHLITEISMIPKVRISESHDEFLVLFAKSPPLSTYQIYHNYKSIHKKNYDKQVRTIVKKLLACKLIEKVDNNISKHRAIYYKLSTAGLYYLVYYKRTEFIESFKIILQQYDKNIIFTTLLYPYLQKSSLENIRDTSLISRIYVHLHECCEEIQSTIESLAKGCQKHIVQQVCIWDYVHERGKDNTRLIDFLKHKFGLGWLDNRVQFEKDIDGNTLSISKDSKRLLIKIVENRTKATLIYNRRELYRFPMSPGHEILYRSEQTAEEWSISFLKSRVESSAADLIMALASRVVIDSDIESLSEDEKFMQLLGENKVKFDNKYQQLIK